MLATLCCIPLPTPVEPVNDTDSTRGLVIISSPTVLPPPQTKFKTPGGKPASTKISTKALPAPGVSVAGLKTMVLPLISAGVHLRPGTLNGKFHGLIIDATPRGRRTL